MSEVSDRQKDYRDNHRHPKRLYATGKRKPGTVWNYHGATPWWADSLKLVPLNYERKIYA